MCVYLIQNISIVGPELGHRNQLQGGQMKAIVYKGPLQVSVDEVEDPRIESATDAIVKPQALPPSPPRSFPSPRLGKGKGGVLSIHGDRSPRRRSADLSTLLACASK